MSHKLMRGLRARSSAVVRGVAASEGLLVAVAMGVGADNLQPGSGLLVFATALYVPAIIDRIRRAA